MREEPKFILSRKKAIEQYGKVKAIADIVSYSSKTNPIVGKILEEKTNCMFSIHISNELANIKDKSRVIFLAQAWKKDEIEQLVNEGVRSFVVDNEKDLDELLDFLKKSKEKIDLMLRLKLKESTVRTERYFVFGMGSEVINKRIKELGKNKNIKSLGIHFHRKSQNMSEWNLKYELSSSLEEETIKAINFVCIGGGIPAEYANTNVDVIKTIFSKIIELKEWLNKNNIKMMIEPGRFIAAPPIKLSTTIIGIHENNIIVNASVYNSDMDSLIVPVKLLVEGELEKGQPYTIKGITPCSMDLFRYRVYLKNPKVGDKIVFLNAGAYNFSTEFCNLERIKTEIIER